MAALDDIVPFCMFILHLVQIPSKEWTRPDTSLFSEFGQDPLIWFPLIHSELSFFVDA